MASVSSLLAIERLLDGKTTLKTKRATHKNIICIGTDVLDHVKALMNEDKEKAVAEAVQEAEKVAAAKLKKETELLEQILTNEREKQIKELKKKHRTKIAEVKRDCAIAEEQRAAEAFERYELEKRKAVEETLEKAKSERDEQIANALEEIKEQLLEEARVDKEKTVAAQLKIASEKALKAQQAAVIEAERMCEIIKKKEMKKLINEYEEKIAQLEQRIEYIQQMFEIEKRRKEDIQQNFMDLKEDYKRFQNYTDKYHSDYLLP